MYDPIEVSFFLFNFNFVTNAAEDKRTSDQGWSFSLNKNPRLQVVDCEQSRRNSTEEGTNTKYLTSRYPNSGGRNHAIGGVPTRRWDLW